MLQVIIGCVNLVRGMASQERQHCDDSSRVLIRPSDCSKLVVKKSSVGHVPYEPIKGAVVRDVCHSAISAASSTVAHGGHSSTTRVNDSKYPKLSLPSHEHAVSPVTEKDNVQLSLMSVQKAADSTATTSCIEQCATQVVMSACLW